MSTVQASDEEIVVQYSARLEILIDRGMKVRAEIVPQYLKQYLKLLRAKHNFTVAYHARTNATATRWDCTFQSVLTKYAGGAVLSWVRLVHFALLTWGIRTSKS